MKKAFKLFLFMTLLTGIIYPLVITGVAQFIMPQAANGKIIYKGEKAIGSSLIAQSFSKEGYFWPRPSASNYNALLSGGSNLGPTSLKLQAAVNERLEKLGHKAPAELVYASGSGLDPHISYEGAYFQLERISKARAIPLDKLMNFLLENETRLLKAPYFNVLELNRALDQQFPSPTN